MANRPTRRSRLARRLASGLLVAGLASDVIAETPDAGVDPANAIEVIADAGGGGSAGDTLYLEVVINGNGTHKLAGFSRAGNDISAGADTLRQLGFRLPEGTGASV